MSRGAAFVRLAATVAGADGQRRRSRTESEQQTLQGKYGVPVSEQ